MSYTSEFTDNFNRADGAPGSNYNTNGTCNIAANLLALSASSSNCQWITATSQADSYVQALVTYTGNPNFNFWIRSDWPISNAYTVIIQSTQHLYYVNNGGTYTQVGSTVTGLTTTSAHTYRLTAEGTTNVTLKVYDNDTQVSTVTHSTGTRITTAGKCGVGTQTISATHNYDNLEIGIISAAASAQLAKVGGIALASVAKYGGIAKASIKKVGGLTIQ